MTDRGHTNTDPPPHLVVPTTTIREILLTSGSGHVYGCCLQACLILGWILKNGGHPAEMWSCTSGGWWHWYVLSGSWILDPTAGQFGEGDDPPLIFAQGSPADRYEPGDEEPPPICEEEIVELLARWVESDADLGLPEEIQGRSGAIAPLLDLAELSHLEPAIKERATELVAAGSGRRRYELARRRFFAEQPGP